MTVHRNPSTTRIDYAYADRLVLGAIAELDAAHAPTAGPMEVRALGDSKPIDWTKPAVFFTGVDCVTKPNSASAPDPHHASVTVKLLVAVSSELVSENAFALGTACSRVAHLLERCTLDEPTLGHRMELEGATVTRLGAIDPIDEEAAPDIVGAAITISGKLVRQTGNTIGSA